MTDLLEVDDWLDVTDNLAEMPIRIHGWDKDRGQYICEWYCGSWVMLNAGGEDYCYVKPTKYRPCSPDPVPEPKAVSDPEAAARAAINYGKAM